MLCEEATILRRRLVRSFPHCCLSPLILATFLCSLYFLVNGWGLDPVTSWISHSHRYISLCRQFERRACSLQTLVGNYPHVWHIKHFPQRRMSTLRHLNITNTVTMLRAVQLLDTPTSVSFVATGLHCITWGLLGERW